MRPNRVSMITGEKYRRCWDNWYKIGLGTDDQIKCEQTLEDIYFDLGHSVSLHSPSSRKRLIDAFKAMADSLPPNPIPRKLDRDGIIKALWQIYNRSWPVWRSGYRMNGEKIALKKMKKLGWRIFEPAKARKWKKRESTQKELSNDESASNYRWKSLDEQCPTRIWNSSLTILKASDPKEELVTQLGKVVKMGAGRESRSLDRMWMDVNTLDFGILMRELELVGWLHPNQSIWWSFEPAKGVYVTRAQQTQLKTSDDFRAAIWDGLVNKFPDFCGPRMEGAPHEPDGAKPSFTLIIRDESEKRCVEAAEEHGRHGGARKKKTRSASS